MGIKMLPVYGTAVGKLVYEQGVNDVKENLVYSNAPPRRFTSDGLANVGIYSGSGG